MTVSILIVCLGNICRSPMGEAVLRYEAAKRKIEIEVDSAGTGAYHIDENPDYRYVHCTILSSRLRRRGFESTACGTTGPVSTCKKHQVPISHTARQVKEADFREFQYILTADESNLRNLMAKKPSEGLGSAVVRLWGSYLDNKPIGDPYYGTIQDFEVCFQQCTKLSNAFLDEVFGKN
ncbi:phosphotyrosine protein phosphatase I superfamily [Chiua virens]|nr:phosphotyrosine protein phosphatase I superfamily [Chiua virens]